MQLRKAVAILASTFVLFALVGCGGPKTVQNQQLTLNLLYGDRTGTYTGEINDQNKPDGKGTFETKNSSGETWVYDGTFKNGHFEGKGKIVWKTSKQTEEGSYSNDRLNGNGKRTIIVNGQQQTYEGNFVAGIPMKAETVGLNEEASFADWTYCVTNVDTRKSAGNMQASGQYLVLTMNAQNNGQEARKPGGNNFYILADTVNGRIYQMDDGALLALRLNGGTSNADWYLTDVNPGNKAIGYLIVFDIPENLDINNLVLLPRQNTADATPIKLQK